jgi:hypothetical protein
MRPSSSQGGVENHMEVIIVSVVGMVVFGGLFIIGCPEWWSSSMGTLKDEKKPDARDTQDPKAGK